MGCHRNHAISHSPNQYFFKDTFVSHQGGPNEQFGTHKKLSWGCKVTRGVYPIRCRVAFASALECSVSLPYCAASWSALSDFGYILSYGSCLVYYNRKKSVLLCKLLNCLSVHTNSELSHNNYCYSRSFK